MDRSEVCNKGLDGDAVVLDAVDRFFRRHDIDVRNRIGDDDGIVPGDDSLGRDVEYDVLGGHLERDCIHIWYDDVQAGSRRNGIFQGAGQRIYTPGEQYALPMRW